MASDSPAAPALQDSDRPAASDGQRWQEILKTWVKPHNSNVTIKLWDRQGERTCKRHRLNSRRLDQTVNKYVAGLLENGVLEELRGMIALLEVLGSSDTYEVVGGGTLLDSIYVASELAPDNEHIMRLKQKGLGNCLVLSAGCPDDDIAWLKQATSPYYTILYSDMLHHIEYRRILTLYHTRFFLYSLL